MFTQICCFPKTEKAQQNEDGLKKQLEEALKEVREINRTSSIFDELKHKYCIMFAFALPAPESYRGAQTRSRRIQGSSSSQR